MIPLPVSTQPHNLSALDLWA